MILFWKQANKSRLCGTGKGRGRVLRDFKDSMDLREFRDYAISLQEVSLNEVSFRGFLVP